MADHTARPPDHLPRVARGLRAAGFRFARQRLHLVAQGCFVLSLLASPTLADATLYHLGIVTRRRGQHATARAYFRMAAPAEPRAFEALLHTPRGRDGPGDDVELRATAGPVAPPTSSGRVRRPRDRGAALLLQRTQRRYLRGARARARNVLASTDWGRASHPGVTFELARQARLAGLDTVETDALRRALTPLPRAVPDLAEVLARLRTLDPELLEVVLPAAALLVTSDRDALAVVEATTAGANLGSDQLFELLVRQMPPDGKPWLRLARDYRNRHLNDLAMRAAERAAELATDPTPAIWLLADLDARLDAGERAVERVLAHQPDLTIPERLRLAWLAQRGNAPHRAVELLADADGWEVEAEPADLLAVATALHQVGRSDEAVEMAGRLDPADPAQRQLRRSWALDVGRFEEAVTLALRETDTAALDRVARRLRRAGQIIDAAQVIERLQRLGAGRKDAGFQRLRAQATVLSGAWRPPPSRPTRRLSTAPAVDVLHVVGSCLPHRQSGFTVRTHATLQAQAAAGIRASAMTLAGFPRDDRSDHTLLDGVRYDHLVPGVEFGAGTVEQLDRSVERGRRLVSRLRPRLLHAHSDFLNPLIAGVLGDEFGIPVVYEMRGFWEETWRSRQPDPDQAQHSQYYRLRRERELQAAATADRVVTLAETMRDELLRQGIAGERIRVVPNAVDTDWFAPRGRDLRLRADLGLDEAELVIGYVSSLVDYEGIDNLIRAVAALRGGGLDARGLIVGDGPERPRLAALAASVGVADALRLTGRVPHERVRDYYAQLDAFVVPRHDVPVCRLVSPLKPLEAMAMEIPLVVSDLPVLREQIDDGRLGALFRADDPHDLAEVLATLAEDRHAAVDRARRARSYVTSARTWDANARRYLDVYRELGVIGDVDAAATPGV